MNQEHIDLQSFTQTPSSDWKQSYITSAVTLLIITILYTVINSFLSDPSTPLQSKLRQLPSTLYAMSVRVGHTMRRLPLSNMGGGSPGGLHKVFGLDSSNLLRSPSIASPSRSITSLLRKGPSDTPAGLGNWDNSCYQNCVIQGLASLPSLPPFLRDVLSRGNAASYDSTNAALLEMVERLHDEGNNGVHLWLPPKLKSMSTWQQQDAQEYFSKILDQVDKEAAATAKLALTSPRSSLGLATAIEDGEDGSDQNVAITREKLELETCALRNPLEGMLAQRVACTLCGYSDGVSLIPFNCLTVQLGGDDSYDIRECLDDYTKLEFIPGVQCPKCTLLRLRLQLRRLLESNAIGADLKDTMSPRLSIVEDALEGEDFADSTIVKKCGVKKQNWALSNKSKQAVIARAPRSLVLHVNRSCFNEITGAQTKNYADVAFPETLDLGPWCVAEQSERSEEIGEEVREGWSMIPGESMLSAADQSNEEIYLLRAAVTHHGRHENGHYICYRMHQVKRSVTMEDAILTKGEEEQLPEERWWQLSDEIVRPVSEEFVLGQGEVFMLFYEKVDIPDAGPILMQVQQVSSDIFMQEATMVEAAEALEVDIPEHDMSTPTNETDMNNTTESASSSVHPTPTVSAGLVTETPSDKAILDHPISDAQDTAPISSLKPANTPSSSRDEILPVAPAEDDPGESSAETEHVPVEPVKRSPVVMRTASIPDSGELDPGGFRMVAAT